MRAVCRVPLTHAVLVAELERIQCLLIDMGSSLATPTRVLVPNVRLRARVFDD